MSLLGEQRHNATSSGNWTVSTTADSPSDANELPVEDWLTILAAASCCRAKLVFLISTRHTHTHSYKPHWLIVHAVGVPHIYTPHTHSYKPHCHQWSWAPWSVDSLSSAVDRRHSLTRRLSSKRLRSSALPRLSDWSSCGFMSHLTQNRSVWRRISKSNLLAWKGKKLNLKQTLQKMYYNTNTHTDTHLTALCPRLPRWAHTGKKKQKN